jgi:hypothetical protein
MYIDNRRTMATTNDRPILPSEGAPHIDKTILVKVNRNNYQVVRPAWTLKPGLTDRLVVGRKVTLTLTIPYVRKMLTHFIVTYYRYASLRHMLRIKGNYTDVDF